MEMEMLRPRTNVHSLLINGPSSSHEFKSSKDRKYMDGSLKAKDQQSLVPSCMRIPLYEVAHSRAGDKGNDLNFSVIPHCPEDISRLQKVITADWVIQVLSPLVVSSSFPGTSTIEERDGLTRGSVTVEIYEVKRIHSQNVVVRNILDGGVNCSRRIDRHGKPISDLILWQKVVLPPLPSEN